LNVDSISILIKASRLPFLILTPVSVFLGASTALVAHGHIDYAVLSLILLGAASAHISVNTLNEYADFRSGLDSRTIRTPFSGGSGALIEHPQMGGAVLRLSILSLLATLAAGLYFVYLRGPALLPIGILGMLIIVTYTPRLNRHPLLCLVAPGLAFGPLMVGGTHFVLTGEYAVLPWLVSLVPFFLASNLLLLNQFPDIEADRAVGRRHFPIAFGVGRSAQVYGVFVAAAFVTIASGVELGYLPTDSYIATVPLGAAIPVFLGVHGYADDVRRLTAYLGLNVFITLVTPVILGTVIIMA